MRVTKQGERGKRDLVKETGNPKEGDPNEGSALQDGGCAACFDRPKDSPRSLRRRLREGAKLLYPTLVFRLLAFRLSDGQ